MLVESLLGIRGVYRRDLDEALAETYARSYGDWVRQLLHRTPTIAIGRDTRPSGPALKHAMITGLHASGCRIVDLDVVTAPMVDLAVREDVSDGGIMVTASHGPPEQNGWKFFNPRIHHDVPAGGLLVPGYIEHLIDTVHGKQEIAVADGQEEIIERYLDFALSFRWFGPGLEEAEAQAICERLRTQFTAHDLKILADPNGGSAAVVMERLLERLGLADRTLLSGAMKGQFQREIIPDETTLKGIADKYRDEVWHIGFGWDCDADRVEVFLPSGEVLLGQDVLAFCVDEVLRVAQQQGQTPPPVVISDVTSRRVIDIARRYQAPVEEVEASQIDVVLAMEKHQSWIGGEGPNGGVIFAPARLRDGLLTMLVVLNRLAQSDRLAELSEATRIGERSLLVKQILQGEDYPFYCTLNANLVFRTQGLSRPEVREEAARVRRRAVEHWRNQGYDIRRAVDETAGFKAIVPAGSPGAGSWIALRASRTEEGVFRVFSDSPQREMSQRLLVDGCEFLESHVPWELVEVQKGKMIDKAVILAGGLGRRMQRAVAEVELDEANRALADRGWKMMILFEGRPFLDYLLQELLDAGYSQFCLVVPPGDSLVRGYYERVSALNSAFEISFAVQEKPLGTANAVAAARAFAGEDSFISLNADNLYSTEVLHKLREAEEGACYAIGYDRDSLVERSNIEAERIARYAVMQVDAHRNLWRIVERPTNPDDYKVDGKVLVSMNVFRFTPVIFEGCADVKPNPAHDNELDLPWAVQHVIDHALAPCKVIYSDDTVLDLTGRGDVEALRAALRDRSLHFKAPEDWLAQQLEAMKGKA